MIDKVCPVVLRKQNQEILLFQHPLAGIQLVKGTVETFDESYITAAKRELAEESGITHVISARYLCSWDSGFQNQAWHFVLCECADLADSWTFHTQDDGGHDFAFFLARYRERYFLTGAYRFSERTGKSSKTDRPRGGVSEVASWRFNKEALVKAPESKRCSIECLRPTTIR